MLPEVLEDRPGRHLRLPGLRAELCGTDVPFGRGPGRGRQLREAPKGRADLLLL